MASVINTNVMSLTAQRQGGINQLGLESTMRQLSSGRRVDSARDDAAALAIAVRMVSDSDGMARAMSNASDAISLAQVGEGAMDEVTNNLERMRELSVQAANPTYSASDRASIQKEISSLQSEITRVTRSTDFNGQKILAQNGQLDFQVGGDGSAAGRIGLTTTSVAAANGTGIGSALGGSLNVNTPANARNAIAMLDTMLDRVSGMRANFGTLQNRFESTIRNLANGRENTEAARSRLQDADYAAQTADLARQQILSQANLAMQAQANAIPQGVVNLLAA